MKLQVTDISFSYKGSAPALSGISLSAREGDMLAVIGQNGSGKSTLLKCLNRILEVRAGDIELDGTPLRALSPHRLSRLIAYVPQAEEYLPGLNVFDTVLLGRKPYIRQSPAADDLRVVSGLLERLELEAEAMRRLDTLSGGQRQRVFIARALAQQPAILLLDEPIANLDINRQMKAMKLLRRLADEGMAVILTIHDINLAARFCNSALMLKRGRVFAAGGESVYTPENIEALYDTPVEILRHNGGIHIIPE